MLAQQSEIDRELNIFKMQNPDILYALVVDDDGFLIGSSFKPNELNEHEIAVATALIHTISTMLEKRVKSGHISVGKHRIIFYDIGNNATLAVVVNTCAPLVKYIRASAVIAGKLRKLIFENKPSKRVLLLRELKQKLMLRRKTA